MKIVINAEHGGFGLSAAAVEEYLTRCGREFWKKPSRWGDTDFFFCHPIEYERIYREDKAKGDYERSNGLWFSEDDIERTDKLLISIIEEYGTEWASGHFASLKIVDVPDGIEWDICDHGGREWVAEKHRTWS